ncbi:integrase [Methanococcoides methylutens]|uniref:Integrase n=1 Tax=Methanococcoides methylutens MM1 TaxID=1434104 RepID=A0A0E3X272_METMT|nr:integrase [Methanococcoides methylutens]AKB85995.1 integrase [Methanococcoides methylutens MM1]
MPYIRYTDRYLTDVPLRDRRDIANISSTVDKGWNNYAKATRNFINFLEDQDLITSQQATDWKKPLKLKKTNQDTWTPSIDAVKNVLKSADNPTYRQFMELLLYSGIRIVEGIHIIQNFDTTKLHFEGDVAYYDIDWKRGKKNANKAFMPAEFAKTLHRVPDISINAVKKYFKVRGMGLKYCRNFFTNKCVKAGISESLIEYMIGHTDGSVLMTNYLDKLNNSLVAYDKVSPTLQEIINDRNK